MVGNDELRSVRIEVDDALAGAEAPSVLGQPTGGPKWPVIIGVLALLAIGLAFVVLRPESNQAADGTERVAPTTTTAPAATTEPPSEPATSEPASRAPEIVVADAIVPVLGDALIATQTNLVTKPIRVVETDTGFLALHLRSAAAGPSLLSSDDGVSWTPVATSIESPEGLDLNSLVSSDLIAMPNQLALLAFTLDEPEGSNEVFFSSDGVEWTAVDTSAVRAQGQDVVTATDTSLITTESRGDAVTEILTEILSSPIDGAISECLARITSSDPGELVSFRSVDLVDQSETHFGSPDSIWNLGSRVEVLSGGRLGFFDTGSTSGLCEGAPELPDDQAPAIVVLEADGETERVFELPVEGRPSVQILGETDFGTDDPAQLLVLFDGALWALNPALGEWTFFVDGLSDRLALSESGNRIYMLGRSFVTIFELDAAASGEPTAVTRRARIQTSETRDDVLFEETEVVFADDGLLFAVEPGGQLWLLEPPLVPGERDREPARDQGGVGISRVR